MNALMPLIEASLRGALLIAVLALLRVPLRRLIGSPWFCALWIVVLIRLIIPGSIQSNWSVFNWWPQEKPVQVQPSAIQTRVTVLPSSSTGASRTTAAVTPLAPASAPTSREWILFAWLAGAVGTAALFSWRIFKTMRMAAFTKPASDPTLLAAFESIAPSLRGNIQLREANHLEVPALVGLWRPQIWIPTSWLESMNEEELRHVLLHEVGHARRGDLWVQWAFALIQCLHWFNPAVWLAARLAHADRELACDAWVLGRADTDEPERYGATLVKAAQMLRSPWHLPPAAITMAMSKGSLFSRVRSIGQFRPVSSWRALVGVAITAGALLSLATDRIHAQQSDGSLPPPAGAGGLDPAPGGIADTTNNSSIDPASGAGGGIPGAAGSPAVPAMPGQPAIAAAAPRSPFQAEIEAKFIEMKDGTWEQLGIDLPANDPQTSAMLMNRGMIDPQSLKKILAAIKAGPGVNLLSAPRITMKSGQRGVIEIIREFRYPTEYDPDEKAPDGVRATAFETRNVGITLEAEPEVSPDGTTIDLTIVPQIVELAGFTSVRTGQPVPMKIDPSHTGLDRILNATLPTDAVVQPIFSTRKVTTSVTLSSGHTMVIGGLRPPSAVQAVDEPRMTFILITARAIGPFSSAGAGMAPPAAGNLTPGAFPALNQENIDNGIFGGGAGSTGAGSAPTPIGGSQLVAPPTLTPLPTPGVPGGTPPIAVPPPLVVPAQPAPPTIPGAAPGQPGAANPGAPGRPAPAITPPAPVPPAPGLSTPRKVIPRGAGQPPAPAPIPAPAPGAAPPAPPSSAPARAPGSPRTSSVSTESDTKVRQPLFAIAINTKLLRKEINRSKPPVLKLPGYY